MTFSGPACLGLSCLRNTVTFLNCCFPPTLSTPPRRSPKKPRNSSWPSLHSVGRWSSTGRALPSTPTCPTVQRRRGVPDQAVSETARHQQRRPQRVLAPDARVMDQLQPSEFQLNRLAWGGVFHSSARLSIPGPTAIQDHPWGVGQIKLDEMMTTPPKPHPISFGSKCDSPNAGFPPVTESRTWQYIVADDRSA